MIPVFENNLIKMKIMLTLMQRQMIISDLGYKNIVEIT